ncbi:MAG: hypothetical protein FJ087_08850 [Deltaproteobacteria bacterium]|nr:hypothetical protein [Deltaproteobacteria bacterium]
MGHRVLGLTWDERTVRVAVIETRLRRFELKAAHEIERVVGGGVPSGEPAWAAEAASAVPSGTTASYEAGMPAAPPPLSVVEALGRALLPPLSGLDSVAIAYPGDRGFVRRVAFPFKEMDKVEAALPMQMVGQILQPDEIHCAFEKVSTASHGTEVLAVAVRREELASWLAERAVEGIDPRHVSLDGVCMLALVPYLPAPEGGGAQMVVWAEGSTLDVVVADGLRPVLARSTSPGEAVTAGGTEPSAAFLREVVLSAAAASESGAALGAVRVGGPRADVLVGPLREALGIPCTVLDPGALSIPGAEACVGLSPAMAKSVALALAAAGSGAGSLDLRGGQFSPEGAHGLLRERFRYFAVALALFALLGIGNAVAKYVGLSAEREAVRADLRAFTAQVLGKERDDFDGVLKTMKALSDEDVRLFPRWTAVDTLNRVIGAVMGMGKRSDASSGAGGEGEGAGTGTGSGTGTGIGWGPGLGEEAGEAAGEQGYKVELESVRVEPRGASMRGEADSIETLDALVAKMKTDPCFKDVVTESTERIQFERHQGWQRFALRFTVDCSPKEAQKKRAGGLPPAGATARATDAPGAADAPAKAKRDE